MCFEKDYFIQAVFFKITVYLITCLPVGTGRVVSVHF